MADSNITKRALAESLKGLMQEAPFEKISIGDICDGCEMNRKSFYYHFTDKYDLVNWIYDFEFYKLSEQQQNTELWSFITALADYLYDNLVFYRKAFQIKGQNSFVEHFRTTTEPIINKFLVDALKSPEKPEYLDFYIKFLSDAFLGAFTRWLQAKDSDSPKLFVDKLHSCIQVIMSLDNP